MEGSFIFATMNPASVGGGRKKLPASTQTLFTQVGGVCCLMLTGMLGLVAKLDSSPRHMLMRDQCHVCQTTLRSACCIKHMSFLNLHAASGCT